MLQESLGNAGKSQDEQDLAAMRTALKQARRHESRKLQRQRQELREARRWQWFQHIGDSLLASPDHYPKGSGECPVHNIHSDCVETVKLNPKFDACANAELLYKKAKKGRRGEEIAARKVEDSQKRLAAAESALDACGEALKLEPRAAEFGLAVEKVREQYKTLAISDNAAETRKKKGAEAKYPYRRFLIDGYECFIGKNDSQNDEMSTRFVRPWDIWLHVAAHSGSHVVIRQKKHAPYPPRAVIERAAALAVWFSKARHTSFAEVHVTEGRYVHKPRKAAPGTVVAQRCKAVRVSPASPRDMFPDYKEY
jgi:predicted ribosome quality control (RQC) complex YloA/Tae2 family protein